MAVQKTLTAEEFTEFVHLPENADRLFEFVNGEAVEVSPGRTRYSEIGHILAFAVRLFCRQRNLPCHTSGGDGAFRILGHILALDFAYKPTPMSDDYLDPVPPLWAVEIISPTDKAADIRTKRQIYREAGILLWEIYLESQSVDIYVPGQPPRTAGIDDTLDCGEILPGFTLAVRDLLAE